MSKVLAALAAVVALLAPASVAQAAPAYDLSIHSALTAFYPVADGFKDTIEISGDVDAGVAHPRIRGSVVITIAGRVVKNVPLSHAGPFAFTWNGRDAKGHLVTGTATLALRVDGQAPVTTTVTVSPKKVVPVHITYKQKFFDGMGCEDAAPGVGGSIANSEYLCPIGYGTPIPDYAFTRIMGTRSVGGVVAVGSFYWFQSKLKHSVLPVKTAFAVQFIQTGTGTTRIWFRSQQPGAGYYDAGPNTVVSFSHSTTVKVSGVTSINFSAGVYDPEWVISVPPSVNLKATFYTVTCTYYVLK